MTAMLTVLRAGPLTTIQDEGRFGLLRDGISASGPMDRGAFALAGAAIGAGLGGIEMTAAGMEFRLGQGHCRVGFAGGDFQIRLNGRALAWPGSASLSTQDVVAVTPGAWGNYGYLRFDADIDIAPVLGSIATNSRTGLGGRALRAGDAIVLADKGQLRQLPVAPRRKAEGPIRVIWGLHADMFAAEVRNGFVAGGFTVSSRLDRMGVRLADPGAIFATATILSLVSDAVVPGDIQILGDGTPIVLMRDHQPTGGYPRIATIISADLDRFAQMRPGSAIAFEPVGVDHAHRLLRSPS